MGVESTCERLDIEWKGLEKKEWANFKHRVTCTCMAHGYKWL